MTENMTPIEREKLTREVEAESMKYRSASSRENERARLAFLNARFVDAREWLVADKIWMEIKVFGHNYSFAL